MLIKRNIELEKTLEKFHCGERFKQLCVLNKRESPSEWVKILGLKSRNQVYYRWSSEELSSKELLIICDQFKITIANFFNQEGAEQNHSHVGDYDKNEYGKKEYIEDKIENALQRIKALENALKI